MASTPKFSEAGKFYAWWESYLRDEGFQATYRPFMDLYKLPELEGRVVGILGMYIPSLKVGHIIAVDECGAVDPAENAPGHMEIREYLLSRTSQGVTFHNDFLAVERRGP